MSHLSSLLATSELRKRPGNSEVDNASWDCFRELKQKARPQKQSRDALSTSLLPGLLRNSEVANIGKTYHILNLTHFWLAAFVRAAYLHGARESEAANQKQSKFPAYVRRKLFLISEIRFVFHFS